MIKPMFKQKAILLVSLTALASNAALASVAFQDPNSAAWGGWTRGDENTSFAHWDHIGGPGTTDTVDSTPDGGNEGTTSAVLTPNNAGAFVTGSGAGGNIYSFSDTPDFTVAVAPDYAGGEGTLALQVKVLGTDLDLNSVTLGGEAWDSNETLFSGDATGPFGGADNEYLFVWDNISLSSPVEVDFMATGSSMSLDEVAVDFSTIDPPAPVPLPAGVWLFLSGLSGLAFKSKRKEKSS